MPLTAASSASPKVPSAAGSATTGRAQDQTTPASKKEQGMATTHTTPNRRPRRHEPTASSSSASSSSGSSSSASAPAVESSHHHHHLHHRSRRLVGVFSKRKGVRYNADGRVVTCRFCEILRDRDEPFLYEDDSLVVFRPLHPIVPSHILIVPRAHIRNVNQLTVDHVALLRRMRAVGDRVLHSHPDLLHSMKHAPRKKEHTPVSPNDVSAEADVCPGLTLADLDNDNDEEERTADPSDTDGRFAFHVPPFNSIDHVHMHAFRGDPGYVGRIKYRTESWWCRSYDEVLARLELQQQQPPPLPPHPRGHGHRPLASTAPPATEICT